MLKKKENGSVVVEASITVPIFIFLILTILSLVDICILQARMTVALNTAAKEISQYSYLYMLTGLDEEHKKIYESSEGVRTSMDDTLEGLQAITDSWITVKEDVAGVDEATADFKTLEEELKKIEKDATGAVKVTKDESKKIYEICKGIASDPKTFIKGVVSLAGNELINAGKSIVAELLAKAFMSKNLREFDGDNAEAYLARNNIVAVDGSYINGLDFSGTQLFANGETDRVQLVCTYEVKVMELLNVDFTFKIRQTAITKAWGKGISSKN